MGPRPLGVWAWLTHENKPPPHMYNHVKFGSSASSDARINRREPPKLGNAGAPPRCGGGVADP